MATLTRVEYISDLTGKVGDVETVRFGVDGTNYEIDLTPDERNTLDQLLSRFVANARRVDGKLNPRPKKTATAPAPTHDAVVRKWLTDNGYNVKPLGRISTANMDAYNNRDRRPAETPKKAAKKATRPRTPTPKTWPAGTMQTALQDAVTAVNPAAAAQATTGKVTAGAVTFVPPTARTRKAATTSAVVEKAPAKKTAAAARKTTTAKAATAVTVPTQTRSRARKAQPQAQQ